MKVSFKNTEIAFSSKSDFDLLRSLWLFRLLSFSLLVKMSYSVLPFIMKIGLPVSWLLKPTVYKHFCGGENIKKALPSINKLHDFGIGTVLDYAAEGLDNEVGFVQTKNQVIEVINFAKNTEAVPFAVFKMSGIIRFALLEKKQSGAELNSIEITEFNLGVKRVDELCQYAHDSNVPIFIDAEESWIQDVIDDIASDMMKKYNKVLPIVFNTLQMYRHDRIGYLKSILKISTDGNFKLGLKLVRGAYMEKERLRAENLKYPSPIHNNKMLTDTDFDMAVEMALNNVDVLSVCVASHNEESFYKMMGIMSDKNIENNTAAVYASQLYGMGDHISYNLANAGYNVAKYLPYGEVRMAVPYLLRRAKENSSIEGQSLRELELIKREIKRRRKNKLQNE